MGVYMQITRRKSNSPEISGPEERQIFYLGPLEQDRVLNKGDMLTAEASEGHTCLGATGSLQIRAALLPEQDTLSICAHGPESSFFLSSVTGLKNIV